MALSTQDVLKLAKQGPLSTTQVTQLATPVAPTPVNQTPVITPADLGTPETPITPVQPKPETPVQPYDIKDIVAEINETYDKPLPQDAEISTARTDVMSLVNQLYGKEGERATRSKLEADPALQAKRQEVQDLTARYQAIAAEAKAIPLQIQQQAMGQGVTAGGMAPIQTAALRNNAIQALSVGSLLSAAQGNLTLALDQVDRAVKAEFDPIKDELEAERANLEMLMSDPAISREEARRGKILEATLNWQESQNLKRENERKSTLDLAAKLGSYGVPNNILTKIQDAKTFDEAMRVAAPYMQDPRVKQDLENAKMDYAVKKAQLDKTNYELKLLQEYDGLTPTEYKKKLADEQKEIELAKTDQEKNRLLSESLGGKVTLMDSILNSSAIDSVVGPTAFSRTTSGWGIVGRVLGGGPLALPSAISAGMDIFSGASDKLVGQTEQFVSKEFLQSLIDVKAQGATFGALTKPEQDALTDAQTYITQRRIYDTEDGNYKEGARVVGYDMSEDDFKREIERIQDLARKAYERATGKSFAQDETDLLDELYQNASSTVTDINPANYF